MTKIQINLSYTKTLLHYITCFSLVLGLLYWEPNLYHAFWFRRFFAIFSGALALLCLMISARKTLLSFLKNRAIVFFIIFSFISLLFHSSKWHAFFGYPLVHPALGSMLASISIGLWLSSLKIDDVLRYSYHVIIGWAAICFGFWLKGDISLRLGFVDSQVIYASCLFAIGCMLSLWHYKNETFNKKYTLVTGSFLLLCLLLSQTRSALFLLLVYVFYTYRSSIISRKKLVVAISLVGVISIILMGVYFSRLYNGKYLIRSIQYRGSLTLASLPVNKSHIFFGEGMGAIENNIHVNGKNYSQLKKDIEDGVRFESSHNYLVDLMVERGIFTAMIFIYIVLKAIHIGYKQKLSTYKLIQAILVFMSVFLFFNNINIQMEIIIWICILFLFQKNNYQRKKAT